MHTRRPARGIVRAWILVTAVLAPLAAAFAAGTGDASPTLFGFTAQQASAELSAMGH